MTAHPLVKTLIPMDMFVDRAAIKIDLAYTGINNLFKQEIYHDKARLWAHQDLAAITLLTARTLYQSHGYTLELKDCLRTYDAQAAMQETEIVKAHPEWMEAPNRLLSPPGTGMHPYAMAIDVCVIDKDGVEIDMGTAFDQLSAASARDYKDLSNDIIQNRYVLEATFVKSAKALNLPLLPLPCEWWDFRFPREMARNYTPLHDADLPPQMQMVNKIENGIEDFGDDHFERLAQQIMDLVDSTS